MRTREAGLLAIKEKRHPQEGQHSADAKRRDPGPSAVARPVKKAPAHWAVIATPKAKYFCKRDWTDKIRKTKLICPSGGAERLVADLVQRFRSSNHIGP